MSLARIEELELSGEREMTEQEAFDIVVKHLFEQKRPSMLKGSTSCAYRGKKGRKCAIGALISDEEYSLELEAKDVTILDLEDALPPSLAGLDIEFLTELQDIHDYAELTTRGTFAVGALRARLREFAAKRGLKTNF